MTAARAVTTPTLHTVEGSLSPRAPFDFAHSLRFATGFTPCAGEQCFTEGELLKGLQVDDQTVVFRVRSVGTTAAPKLAFALHSDRPLSAATARRAEDRIAQYFSLDDDLSGFYEVAMKDRAFAPLAKRLYGFHQVRFLTPIEIAVWAVLGQRTPMAVARRIKDRLVAELGGSLGVDGHLYRAFPDVPVLERVTPAQWLKLTGNERKARYAHAVVRAFATVDERFLRTAPQEEVKAWLLGIDGIGPWSSAFILFRGLGRTEHCPLSEPIAKAAAPIYGRRSRAELQRILDGYGAARGYWALHLRTQDALPA